MNEKKKKLLGYEARAEGCLAIIDECKELAKTDPHKALELLSNTFFEFCKNQKEWTECLFERLEN